MTKIVSPQNPAIDPKDKRLVPLMPPPPHGMGLPEVEVNFRAADKCIKMPTMVPSKMVGPDGKQVMEKRELTYTLQELDMPLPCGKATLFVYILDGAQPELVLQCTYAYIVGRMTQLAFQGIGG